MRARADGRTGADDAVGRTSGRADGAERPRMVRRTGAERVRTVEQRGRRGPRGADTRTSGRGADGRTGGRADKRSGGRVDWAVEASIARTAGGADGRTGSPPVGRMGERADERVGLGLKSHIPRGPLHSWAPSPLASSERERAGCLGA